ncbi:MAG: bifunctional metallophosphatase/5'-nucleotidase [Muribaculaceae bacterium]|nr:bifunctional metallophosphatase/5'-nucleotidase [Muribaculaceae bacterium]
MNPFKKLLLAGLLAVSIMPAMEAEHLVIAAVNDTHSQIDPASDGKGGLLRRRAIYDQIRRENKNTMIIHGGDAVQGTIYFSLFKGEVEFAAIDSMGYDMITLGNHEFDNGIVKLADYYNRLKTPVVSTNYDFSATPVKGVMPYLIKTFGGKRVGFIGINVNPRGMVSEGNYDGLVYQNGALVADPTAKYLKEVQKVDYVVMVSHIGYFAEIPGEPCDSDVVTKSHYIDIVIGGHTHSEIKPGSPQANVKNADGKIVPIGQNGKYGKLVGVYDLDLETGKVEYKHIKVNSAYDEGAKKYPEFEKWLYPYKSKVDSIMNAPVGESARAMAASSDAYQNWLCDAVMDIIKTMYNGKVDLCIMNKGGIRQDMPKGMVSEGLINSTFPFDNRFMVLDIKGKDLIEAFRVMSLRGGDAVSKQVSVVYNSKNEILSAKLNGKQIKPEQSYKLVTINFLANGGDFLDSLRNGKVLFTDTVPYGEHMLEYVKQLAAQGKKVDATDTPRFVKK